MQIVEPNVEYLPQNDPIDLVAKCGHVCYCTPEKDHEANVKFYNNLVKSGHLSVLRHESHYYIVKDVDDEVADYLIRYAYCSYVEMQWATIRKGIMEEERFLCIATNGQFLLENEDFRVALAKCEVSPEEFKKWAPELCRYTFCLTTQISTSRELNRSTLAITEMSTRYIKFGGSKIEPSIVRPHWMTKDYAEHYNLGDFSGPNDTVAQNYVKATQVAFQYYDILTKSDMKAQEARGVLPLDAMTKVIYTGSMKQWRHCINLRYFGTTGAPQGNAKVIIGMVKNELEKLGYEFNK